MSSAESDSPNFLTKNWVKKMMGVSGQQARAIEREFVTREQLLDALEDGEVLQSYDGIGKKTAGAIWRWYKEDYGETVEADDTLVLDDEGLHLPEWLVGYSGRFTIETPSITMQPTASKQGLPEVSSILGTYPGPGLWNERLSEGQMAISAPGHPERIYDIDDQRTDEEAGSA